MDKPDFIIIINENSVYEISANGEKEAIIMAIEEHQRKWLDIWDKKVKANKATKKEMMSDEEILSSQDIKVIRIFFK